MNKLILPPSKEFLSVLLNASGVLITPHEGPDGDAVASSVALSLILEKKDIPSIILSSDKKTFTKEFTRLKGLLKSSANPEVRFEAKDVKGLLGNHPVHVYVDCSQKNRIGNALNEIISEGIIPDPYSNTIAIDHHEKPDDFISIFADKDSPSTGNMMFVLAKSLNIDIQGDVATAIYYAIASDTDNFRHLTAKDSQTFKDAAECVEGGAIPGIVYSTLHAGKSFESLAYLEKVLKNITSLCGNKVIIATDDKQMFNKYGREIRPSQIVYDLLLSINKVELIAYLKYKENENEIEGSLRVSPSSLWQAHEIAYDVACGGGHEKAAGFTFKGTMEEAYDKLCREIERRA